MAEAATALTRLAIIREIQEDGQGATLHFQQGGQGRLDVNDANYAAHLRLARRSHERQHPLGVRFGEGQTIAELIRADNDVPTELCEDATGARVILQGHDGIFRTKADHPGYARLREVLGNAIQRKAPIWFIVRKADLLLMDILPAGGRENE